MQFLIYKNSNSFSEYMSPFVNSVVNQCLCYVQYLEENLFLISLVLILYIVVCISLYVTFSNIDNKGDLKSKEKILFIISHPDDECMFFGPAILNLTICKEKKIFLLCFSYGDYNQKGRQRKQELWQSCSFLGIPESNIFLQKISVLPDDPKRMWNENVIFRIIINYVETFHFDAVVSFDKDGISGHPNHKAIYYGLAHTLANESFPDYCSIYCLDSVNKFRKYSFILDFLFSICFSSNWFILPPSRCYLVKKAMKAHRTQYVWFRKLYIWISRYAYINTFSLLYANEAIFDLNFRGVCD